jgi:hypothetical protein
MEPPCFFLTLEKVSTIAAADAMKESSSSDDDSSNWLRRRDLFVGMFTVMTIVYNQRWPTPCHKEDGTIVYCNDRMTWSMANTMSQGSEMAVYNQGEEEEMMQVMDDQRTYLGDRSVKLQASFGEVPAGVLDERG